MENLYNSVHSAWEGCELYGVLICVCYTKMAFVTGLADGLDLAKQENSIHSVVGTGLSGGPNRICAFVIKIISLDNFHS